MDRRLLERRRRVAEERARSNLSRLIRLLVGLAGLAAVVWFLQSPFLSVSEVRVSGSDRPEVIELLAEAGVVEGRPMLLVDPERAEHALEADPWVAEATVARDWPTRVEVEITQRRPAAAWKSEAGWWLVADDGTLLEQTEEPAPALGVIADGFDEQGRAAAAAFLGGLPPRYRPGSWVGQGSEGMEGEVAGFRVRLGPPFDMAEKADVVVALIESGIEEGSVITVVAPASPALLPPTPEEGDEQP